jgi:glycosyltransferase involved in cell wall biosynthesis
MARLPGRRPPVLFTEHGRLFPDYPRPKRLAANRVLLGRRDRVVAVGQAVRQALIDNEGIPSHRVEVIYNGIDMAAFSAGGDRKALRRELGLGADDLVLLQVARLDPYKDHATALRTVEIVARVRPEARLVLIGEGSEEAMIRGMVRERGLEPNVRLLGLRTGVARLLPVADLFLLTSITEGIPVTLIEAMASSLPVVGTRVGGMSEVVEEGRTGFLAPSGDESSLAESILRLSADTDLRLQMGRLGAERARCFFSEQQMHAGYQQCYEAILDPPTRGTVGSRPHLSIPAMEK